MGLRSGVQQFIYGEFIEPLLREGNPKSGCDPPLAGELPDTHDIKHILSGTLGEHDLEPFKIHDDTTGGNRG